MVLNGASCRRGRRRGVCRLGESQISAAARTRTTLETATAIRGPGRAAVAAEAGLGLPTGSCRGARAAGAGLAAAGGERGAMGRLHCGTDGWNWNGPGWSGLDPAWRSRDGLTRDGRSADAGALGGRIPEWVRCGDGTASLSCCPRRGHGIRDGMRRSGPCRTGGRCWTTLVYLGLA